MTKLQQQVDRRAARVRAKVSGTPERPRLSVKITAKNITAQVIDDTKGITLAYVTTVGRSMEGTMTAKATALGEEIADLAKKKKVSKVVFDRGSRIYHGRLDALATAARNSGLEF
jgi:large subunit ribosomal protein L18